MNTHTTISPMQQPTPTDRDAVADVIERFQPADTAFLSLMMDNPQQDDALIDGLHRFLDRSAGARFLHTLKLEQRGFWLGSVAPARLQIRLTEAARSSQHAAYQAFRAGLTKSGGLERAFPKA
ncbi:hypothetical protein [Rhizobium sp. 9140]|uniref:hypothetical protein n=1 Tax=Rhizobium sp. 9140 TaxID=1761900 RepID=UPI00079B469D|nr:hypothetical protein [Rhizobium sp. 9140]CZT35493.1 hypothetical protein GA0004734_00025020 [Rhizobium sp. 9140]